MRTTLLPLMIILLLLGTALAQEDTTDVVHYEQNWISHQFIDYTSDVTRSMAYNPVTDHILVATRKGGPRVVIMDPANGDSIGTLSAGEDGYEDGIYPLNMVAVADDGTIYLSNLSAPQYSPADYLKIYRYADEDAEPEVVYEDDLLGIRYGDALAAVGSGDNKYVYCSGQGSSEMVVLRDTGAAELENMGLVTLPIAGNARHGISAMSPGGNVWVNGADSGYPPPTLLAPDGTVIAVVPDSLISAGGSAAITHTILGQYNLVTVVNPYSGTIRSARFFEDELGGITFDYFGGDSDSSDLDWEMGYMTDVNGSSAVTYDPVRNAFITLLGVNSIASLSLEPMLKTSTPRIGTLEVSIDGVMDFFPSDRIGVSNGREFYMTWSEGKVYFGLTGEETLLDPSLSRQLYLVFSLDDESGSTTPPTTAGGIDAYPIAADIVYQIDSWEEADFLTGVIHKWDGSQWVGTTFEDFAASTGALAWVDDLTEVAAVLNEPGLGLEIGALDLLAYLTENDPEAAIHSVFPAENENTPGGGLGYWYHADSLGSGMFPRDLNDVMVMDWGLAVDDAMTAAPVAFDLLGAWPNPFNPVTGIHYELGAPAEVELVIHDIRGAEIARNELGVQTAGAYTLHLDLAAKASGVYLYSLRVDGVVRASDKLLLLK